MRHRTHAIAFAVLTIAAAASAQSRTPMKPTAPGTPGDPIWQAVVRMSDGRTFITDGGLAVDVTLAKPNPLPARQVPGTVLEKSMKAPHTSECGFGDLTLTPTGKTFVSPSGIALNATYVAYLRRVAPRGARFQMTDGMHAIVVAAGGPPFAVLMPVKQ